MEVEVTKEISTRVEDMLQGCRVDSLTVEKITVTGNEISMDVDLEMNNGFILPCKVELDFNDDSGLARLVQDQITGSREKI